MNNEKVARKHSFQLVGQASSNSNDIVLLVLIPLTALTFIIVALFNAASSTGFIKGLFKNLTGSVSASSETYITPSGWTFSTWGIIYAWQALWIVFNIALIFIRGAEGRYYNNPPVLNIWFHIFILINFILNIVWLFVWDNKEFTGAFIILLLMTVALYIALVFSHRNSYFAEEELGSYPAKWVLWGYRVLVNNGVAFYATWITIATNLNLSIAITYQWSDQANITANKSTSAIIGLSILTAIIVIYFIMDIYAFENYLRFTFSPYIQLAIGLSGILTKNWNPQEPAAIFALVLIIIGPGLMFLAKIISTTYRVLNGY